MPLARTPWDAINYLHDSGGYLVICNNSLSPLLSWYHRTSLQESKVTHYCIWFSKRQWDTFVGSGWTPVSELTKAAFFPYMDLTWSFWLSPWRLPWHEQNEMRHVARRKGGMRRDESEKEPGALCSDKVFQREVTRCLLFYSTKVTHWTLDHTTQFHKFYFYLVSYWWWRLRLLFLFEKPLIT